MHEMLYEPGYFDVAYIAGWVADVVTGFNEYGEWCDWVYIFDCDVTYFEIQICLN